MQSKIQGEKTNLLSLQHLQRLIRDIKNHKWKSENKQAVNQRCGIKSLRSDPRAMHECVCMCVLYSKGWLAATCEAIIETRSARGLNCNTAMHTHSLIILKHTHLSALATLVPLLSPPVSITHPAPLALITFYTEDQFLTCLHSCFFCAGSFNIRPHERDYSKKSYQASVVFKRHQDKNIMLIKMCCLFSGCINIKSDSWDKGDTRQSGEAAKKLIASWKYVWICWYLSMRCIQGRHIWGTLKCTDREEVPQSQTPTISPSSKALFPPSSPVWINIVW